MTSENDRITKLQRLEGTSRDGVQPPAKQAVCSKLQKKTSVYFRWSKIHIFNLASDQSVIVTYLLWKITIHHFWDSTEAF